MLRRFQMSGQTLESEVVEERLLLTYSPVNQLLDNSARHGRGRTTNPTESTDADTNSPMPPST